MLFVVCVFQLFQWLPIPHFVLKNSKSLLHVEEEEEGNWLIIKEMAFPEGKDRLHLPQNQRRSCGYVVGSVSLLPRHMPKAPHALMFRSPTRGLGVIILDKPCHGKSCEWKGK